MKSVNGEGVLVYILFACGAAALVLWRISIHSTSAWPDFFLQAYLLTGGLFGVLLIGEYPDFGSATFRKSMIPIFAMHAAVLVALVMISEVSTVIDPGLPTRIVYGFVGVTCVLEWRVCLWIIEAVGKKGDELDRED